MRRKLLLSLVALLIVVASALVLYVKYGDHRARVERMVSEALGRQLTIEGRFESDVGRTIRLLAEDVALAAPAWSDGPAFVSVERLEGSVDLWSLFRGPVRVGDLKLDGARVALEIDGEGRTSWRLGREKGDAGAKTADPAVGVLFAQAELSDVRLSYRHAARDKPLEIVVEELELETDDAGMLDLGASGTLNELPVEVAGRLGTFDDVIAGTGIEHRLSGQVGDVAFAVEGRIAELADLAANPDLELEIHGPDLAVLTEALGMASPVPGAFRIAGSVRPTAGSVAVRLDVDAQELHGEVRGTVADPLDAGELELEIALSGPDLTAIGALAHLETLPAGPFEVAGALLRTEGRTEFREVRGHVGENSVLLDGVLGAWPRMEGTDFTFEAEGPDASTFSAAAGVDLPGKEFRIAGRAVRREDGIDLEELGARIGETTLRIVGVVGDWPRFSGTDLDLHLVCPDASGFGTLVDFELPSAPVELRGRLRPEENHLVLEGVEAMLGGDRFRIDGTVATEDGFTGTDLRFRLSGSDLSRVAVLVGRERFPAGPFDVAGRARVLERGYRLEAIRVRVGELELDVDGYLGPAPGLRDSDLQIRASGPDLRRVAEFAGDEGWPAQPFTAAGRLKVLDRGVTLEGVEGTVGIVSVVLEGRVVPRTDEAWTTLDIELRGEDLSVLDDYLGTGPLPAERFAVRGRLEMPPGGYRLKQMVGRLGEHDVEGDGTIVRGDGLAGTELDLRFAGPSSADMARLLADPGWVELKRMPELPYEVSGRLGLLASGYRLGDVAARLGEATLHVEGTLGTLPDGHDTDLSVDARGPDGAVAGAIAGIELPAEPFEVRGRVRRATSGARFDDVRLRFGAHRLEIDGDLGEPPKLIGTSLDVLAEGPGLELLSQLFEMPLADAPFAIAGHLDGSPQEFVLRDFAVRLGDSDLAGSLQIDLRNKPGLRGELVSERIDLPALRGLEPPAENPEPVATTAEAGPAEPEEEASGNGSGWVISDEPLPLDWLGSFDADVDWRIGRLETLVMPPHAVELDLTLEDGRLQVGPLKGDPEGGGAFFGEVVVEPWQEAYRLTTTLRVEQLRLALSNAVTERERRPPYDARIELTGTGRSLHEMAGSADGVVVVVQGEGDFDNSTLRLLTADAVYQTVSTLNPFAEKERYTGLACGIHMAEIEDGRATLQPLVMVTDKMKIIGRGEIDLETEKLDLSWAAKPRKGIGLSASALTNPYVKLGGTLNDPSVTIKPLSAVTSTAAAVTTGGLSFLVKGFWDRATSGKEICKKAREQAGFE